MQELLPLVWMLIIGFGILMYIILDGFSLGVGILYPFAKNEQERTVMMNAILPIWDGNETWLVFGAAALYGAFPHAFSILLPTLYFPLLIMIIALLFRGVAFEFRLKAQRTRIVWSSAFFIGSVAAAFAQGLVLGSFVQGIPIVNDQPILEYVWFSQFSLFTGFSLVLAYPILGATWLIAKTSGSLQTHMNDIARVLLYIIGIIFLVALGWTATINPWIYQKWLTAKVLFATFLLIMGVLFILTLMALKKCKEFYPFYLSVALFIIAYVGLGASIWPYIVPPIFTFWQVAAPNSTLLFILPGVIILLPLLLGYTLYSYYVFKGKITHETYYH